MTSDIAQAAVSKDVAYDYETLRTAARGDALAFEARNGLALFLRRGMWGWARAISDPSDGPRPTQPARAGTVADDDGKAVVQLLADMAMSSVVRRIHARRSQNSDASPRA
jgi:hypothetical protein